MAYAPDWFARYPAIRRRVEVAFWVGVLALQAAFNTLVAWVDLPRVAAWQPVVWEVSSALATGLLIPAIVVFERGVPLRWETLRTALPLHLVASLVFCVLHVAGMVLLRQAAYALVGARYGFGDWPLQLAYEYLKDVRSYALIVAGRPLAAPTRRPCPRRVRRVFWCASCAASSWWPRRTSSGCRPRAITWGCTSMGTTICCARRSPSSCSSWTRSVSCACTAATR